MFHLASDLLANLFGSISQLLLLCDTVFVFSSGFDEILSLSKFVPGFSQLVSLEIEHGHLGPSDLARLVVLVHSTGPSGETPKGGRRALGDFGVEQLFGGIP